jgi:hypothetical protein
MIMKKAIIRIFHLPKYILAAALIFSGCQEKNSFKKEIPVEENNKRAAATIKPSKASLLPELSSPVKKENTILDIPLKDLPSVKNIPIRKFFDYNLQFVENKGQLERFYNFRSSNIGKVGFYTKAFNGAAYFSNNGIEYGFLKGGLENSYANYNKEYKRKKLSKAEKLIQTGFSVSFVNCNEHVSMAGLGLNHTTVNFLKGSPGQFITDIKTFNKLQYTSLYPGIDLIYSSIGGELKYDFVVKANADANLIRLKYHGVKNLSITDDGKLNVEIDWGILEDKKPYSYQLIDGKEKEVEVKYFLVDENTLGFKVLNGYDKTKDLVIDPFTLAWATYIGTATSDNGYVESTVIDASGRVLGTGWTDNSFPIAASPNGYDQTYNNGNDAYVFRLNSAGTTMDYVSYLGGGGDEVGTGIAINSLGDICVSGHTTSFSQTAFVENTTSTLNVVTGNQNVTVAGIGSYGNPQDIILTGGGNTMYGTVYGFANGTTLMVNFTSVTGSGSFSTWAISKVLQAPFPTTAGSIQTSKTGADANEDIFYVRLNASAPYNLIYGTYYGGTVSQSDWAIDLALDGSDNAYITGRTQTTAGFSTAGAFMTAAGGGYDSYVLKINFAGTLGYCTYIGGAGNDIAKGITMTSTNEALIVGMTTSSGMASAGAYQTSIAGADDAFLFKLSSTGAARVFCTYLGGVNQDGAAGIDLVLPSNEPIIVGTTSSANFPVLNAVDGTYNNGDGMIARFKADGSALKYSSYIGGDGTDNVKGYDYTTVAKFGGIKVVSGKPVVVMGMSSTAASMATFLVNTITYTAYDQTVPGTYTFNTGTYSGGPLGDILVVVFDSVSLSTPTVLFGSYFGGTQNDYPTAGVNVDLSSGCVVFGGGVHSLPFPVTVGSFETSRVNNTVNDQPAIAKVCLASILPVEFLNFNVHEQNGSVAIDWSTATETNNSYFEIFKSTDGKTFYSIGRVEGNGTSSGISSYTFTDQQPGSGISYYKIKQVDVNGDYMFSTVRSLNILSFGDIQITPNPGNGHIKIRTTMIANANLEIAVISPLGEKVYGSKEKASKGIYEKDINIQNFASGIYLMQIISGNEVKTLKYVKE